MKISEIEEELISAIYEIQKVSDEKEVNIDKNTCPFALPHFDSLRFCEMLTQTKFDDINFNKIEKKLTVKSTIKDIAEVIQIQLNNNKREKYEK